MIIIVKISDLKVVSDLRLKFKSLPLKKQRLVSFLGLVVLLVALPVFVFAIGKRTNFFNRAASGEISGEHTPTPKPTYTPSATFQPTPPSTPVGCVRASQTVALAPSTNQAIAGEDATYEVSVKNNDALNCPVSDFSLTPIFPANGGFISGYQYYQFKILPGETFKENITFASSQYFPAQIVPVGVSITGPWSVITGYANLQILPTATPTPTIKPTPTPIVIQNNKPVITTTFLQLARVKKSYSAVISGYDLDAKDKLSMTINGLPTGIKMGQCVYGSNGKIISISCQISGTAKSWGIYRVNTVLNDTHTATSKDIILIVLPF